MQAIVSEVYGSPDVMTLKEVTKPTPRENEVLIKVQATSLNASGSHFLRGNPILMRLITGLLKPKNSILGADLAGVVEAIGSNVKEFQIGDEVYGDLARFGFGGFAEYTCAPVEAVALKPSNITFIEAAAVPMAAGTALQALQKVDQIKAGDKVMIHGASGGVGSFAVQLARAFGAEVTAVCSTSKVELARSMGATHVIDYKKEDFTKNGVQYDVIICANGDRSLKDYADALTPTGTFILVGGTMSQLYQTVLLGPFRSRKGGKTIKNFMAKPGKDDLLAMNDLLESGKLTPIIDRCYPLAEVPDAMRYLEAGHASGKIVITIGDLAKLSHVE